MINNLNSLKSMVNPLENSSDTLKNCGARIFANPNTTIIGDKRALAPQSPKDMNEGIADRFSSYLQPNYSGQEPSFNINNHNLQGLTPKSNDNFESFLEMNRSNSISDSLGKRNDLLSHGMEADLPSHDPLYGAKRRLGEMAADPIMQSPRANFDLSKQRSGQASPAHSFTGGFKLHPSRKNSDLQDLGPELKPQPAKKAGDELLAGKT